MDIRLNIDEIVLHGFSEYKYKYNIKDAIEKELARIISEKGLDDNNLEKGQQQYAKDIEDNNNFNNSSFSKSDGKSFGISSNSKPEDIGHKIASSIYQQLRGNKSYTINKNS